MDDFRIMNAIAPSAQPPAEAADTPKAIELSEQTPLVGVAALLSVVDAGLFYALCRGRGSFWRA